MVRLSAAAAGLLVRHHVGQLRQRAQTFEDARRPGAELRDVRVGQRVLVLGARKTAADVDVLGSLQIEVDALHRRQLAAAAARITSSALAVRPDSFDFSVMKKKLLLKLVLPRLKPTLSIAGSWRAMSAMAVIRSLIALKEMS